MRQLYHSEDQARGLSPEQRQVLRRQQAPPLWRALKKRALELKADPAGRPKSTLGKAVNYFLNEDTALVGYLRQGRFEIDNNLVENAIRPAAVGRRRWLFIGHPDAGGRSAVLYSIMISCRRRGINPQEYRSDVLRRRPALKDTPLEQLRPDRGKPEPVEKPPE